MTLIHSKNKIHYYSQTSIKWSLSGRDNCMLNRGGHLKTVDHSALRAFVVVLILSLKESHLNSFSSFRGVK